MKKLLIIALAAFTFSATFADNKKQELKYIGMPVGGICAGQVYLGGDGQLWNWDIFNVMATEPGHTAGDTYYLNPLTQEQTFVNGFGITVRKGKQLHQRGLNSTGFSDIEFEGEYPIGRVTYKDKYMPVEVELTAYSPFIPTDADDSGLPITVLEYTVRNTEDVDVDIEIAGWMQNMSLYQTARGKAGEHVNRTVKTDKFVRVVMDSKSEGLKDTQADWGSMSLTLLGDGSDSASASARCGKTKGIPTYIVDAKVTEAEAAIGDPLVGGVAGRATLKAGESKTFKFLVSWYFPNIHLWNGGHNIKNREDLRYYYSSKFNSAAAVSDYVIEKPQLMEDTKLWVKTWYDSSLPEWFLDRTFINVSTLATTAAVRFDDLKDSPENEGRFYTAEGVYLGEGTCTHVFHYEQAMGRVFPALARQLREQIDLGLSYEDGVIRYRGEFDFGQHDGRNYAVDGQAGTILRIYREHLMSSDKEFITSNWANIKGAMKYMIDQDKAKTGKADGILEGVQYNTLDRMWYGKISWISGMYAAALKASAEMATEVGDKRFAKECAAIAEMAYDNISAELFDGEYFIHITDPEHPEAPNSNKGCHIDQLLGQYWASQLGLGYIVPEDQVKSALKSIVKYNFVENYDEFLKSSEIPISRWYADQDESGLIMCSFPKGGADKAPGLVKSDWEKLVVGYFSEIWTGQEHAVAAALIDEGLIEEAMKVEKALDDRYSADKRNPYNEIEYGNHYTRAMSGFAPFISASGFYYHGSKGVIGFDPKIDADDFKSAFITGEGWGSFAQKRSGDDQKYTLTLEYGKLALNELKLSTGSEKLDDVSVTLNGKAMKVKHSVKDDVLKIMLPSVDMKAGDVLAVSAR